MKYLYLGAAILAVLLAACILSGVLVSTATEGALDSLDLALEAFDRSGLAQAAPYAKAAKQDWQRHSRLLSALLGHEELDEIEALFTSLESYTRTASADDFRSVCAELALRLRHITQMDVPFYYNFFVRSIGS